MKHTKNELEQTALAVRESIIRMSYNGGCFIGASLSCTDIIVYLYSELLRIDKTNLKDKNRDYFFLSKGHDVPALYGTLAELGFIPKNRLLNHLQVNDNFYWHPNTNIPGVEFHSGSLGHLLSIAIGVAYDCKLKGGPNKIFVMLGDGELNEGSVWEGLLLASALKLNNLISIVDRNHFQANCKTEDLIPIESIEKKAEAFGWDVIHCNGHNFYSIDECFSETANICKRPIIIIADTVRGKGLPSIESRADRWFCNFSASEVDQLINELYYNQTANIESEVLIVR